MHIDLLISMANQIGDFFAGANPEHASRDVANHLKRYWEPRMRAQMLAYYAQRNGAGLSDIAHAAVGQLARPRAPPPPPAGCGPHVRQTMSAAAGAALICGSMAYDTIMVFADRFANHILPDKIHMLNVSFLVPQLRREFGGCAGNIAYNLKLLGDCGYPMATVGRDFAPYREWLTHTGVPADYLRVIEGELTAQAFITTDLDDNQITAFHPGAMQHAHQNRVTDARGISLGIVAPDGRAGMLEHAAQFAEAGIPFIFDPGQGLPLFGGEELKALHLAGEVGHPQRLRMAAGAAENRLGGTRAHRARGRAHRHPRRRRLEHLHRRHAAVDPERPGE